MVIFKYGPIKSSLKAGYQILDRIITGLKLSNDLDLTTMFVSGLNFILILIRIHEFNIIKNVSV